MNHEILFHLRNIQAEDSYHCLLEWPDPLLDVLVGLFSFERDCREAAVHIAWQRAEPGTQEFLAVALENPDPAVWKEALDGLVSSGQPAEQILKNARSRSEGERRLWIEEALAQLSAGPT